MDFTMTKKSIGNQGLFLYEVKDQNDRLIGKRTSARTYVACTVLTNERPGKAVEFYIRNWFGRKNLIGKGESGRYMGNPGTYIAMLKEENEQKSEVTQPQGV